MIKDCINFDKNSKQDFWLHRYSNANYLEEIFKSKIFNLRFNTAVFFEDPYEGWDTEEKGLKDDMDLIVGFYNRVINDGGKTENLSCVLKNLVRKDKKELIEIIKRFEDYNRKRNSTFISCWFKTDTLDEENRAMWKLYGNNEDGIRISVKWSDLKKQLNRSEQEFDVGFIDYGNQKNTENLFFIKDKSYDHEREFRIAFSDEIKNENITIPLQNLEKIDCVVRSQYSKNCINDRLDKLGFKPDENSKRVRKISNLSFEAKQVDWTAVLELLNKEII